MQTTFKAAGVLPYAKDGSGQTWFLLGRERPNENWGVDSSSWSEFGGSLDKHESVEEGAAREFFEETMGVVFGHRFWMENELKQGRYLLVMDSRTPTGKGYRLFVKQVPFVNYPEKFARYKTISKKQTELFKIIAPFCFQSDGHLLPSCYEKTSMCWFSVDQMRKAVDKYKQYKHDQTTIRININKHLKPFYDENENVPHIRRGFAMDFAHLLNTSWGRDNFRNDEKHFIPQTFLKANNMSHDKRENVTLELMKTPGGFLKPVLKTPRFSGDRSQTKVPPVVVVDTEGYSFKKKRKRKKSSKQTTQEYGPKKEDKWVVVSSKKSIHRLKIKNNKEVHTNERYKPNPPTF